MVSPDVASSVYSLVGNSKNRQITGVQLSVLVRHQFPDFRPESYGCRNLRAFIRQNVPNIVEVGKSGADVIYGIRSSTQFAPVTSPVSFNATSATTAPGSSPESGHRTGAFISSSVWKTFVSPSSPFRLYANRENGAFDLVVGETQLPSPWVLIPPVSMDFHRQLAKEFVSTVEDRFARNQLETATTGPGAWWKNYYAVVQQLALGPRWNQFRRRRIVHELEGTLKSNNIPASAFRSTPASPRVQDIHASTGVANSPAVARREPTTDVRLRAVVIDAVRKMSAAELRELKLPLGYVVDALTVELK